MLFKILIIVMITSASISAQERSLRVRFLDPSCNNSPVRNVKVKVKGDSGFSKTYKTDAEGWISARNLPKATYHLTAKKYGFKVHIFRDIRLDEYSLSYERTYELQRGYRSSDPNVGSPKYEPCKHEDKD